FSDPNRLQAAPRMGVPPTMELLGDKNWWMPKWLDRIIPNLDIEPTEPLAAPGDRDPSGPSADIGEHEPSMA
ncbi:MAG: hypothetical protein ABIR32_20845, partial [Ilumatobacteraceae bacterium]